METVNYGSMFYTVRANFDTIVYHKDTESLVATMRWIPDPRWPRYEVLDWTGYAVEVALEEPQAHKILADVVNNWLSEDPYAVREGSSSPVEKVQVDGIDNSSDANDYKF